MRFAFVIEQYANLGILLIAGILTLVALLHCAFQRQDAFPMLGALSKGAWLAILGGCTLLTMLSLAGTMGGGGGGVFFIFSLIGIIAGCVYLLDVRPRLRDGDI